MSASDFFDSIVQGVSSAADVGGFPFGSLVSAGAGLLGGAIGYEGQMNTNSANAAQAREQMEFQERMSNTAYQRAVKDMRAAGLNPMLAYSRGGASTPGGAMATMQNAAEAGVSSAVRGAQVSSQLDLLRSQVDNVRADTHLKEAQALVSAAQVPNFHAVTRRETSSADQVDALVARLKEENEGGFARLSLERLFQQGQLTSQQAKELRDFNSRPRLDALTGGEARRVEMINRARKEAAESVLRELEEPRARNLANAQSDWWMQGVSPYLDDVAKISNSAGDLSRLIPWHRLMPFRFR